MSSHLVWKRRLGHLWSKLPRDRSTTRNVVLLYHSVGGGPWATDVVSFKEQLEWLAEHATVIPLDDILRFEKEGDNNKLRVSLTFDDGYRTLHDVVAPMLKRFDFTATVYLNTDQIGKDIRCRSDLAQGHYLGEDFMLWEEVNSLVSKNWTVGSHGLQHLDLTMQPDEFVLEQLVNSKQKIANQLNRECRHFSYTWGRHDSRVRMLVAESGYFSAVSGHHAALRPKDDLMMLPRIDIRREYCLNDFISVVKGNWDYLYFLQKVRNLIT